MLDDVFWTVIPFGTGGRRGKMYPIGSNAINDRTIGESAQGLADYVQRYARRRRAALVRDCLRHAASVRALCPAVRRNHDGGRLHGLLSARLSQHAGVVVHGALQEVLVRHHGHGQPQSAERQRGESVLVDGRANSAAARQGHHRARDEHPGNSPRRISTRCSRPARSCAARTKSTPSFKQAVLTQATPGPRDLKVIYSPLHGVGATAVIPVLAADGFKEVEVFGPHAQAGRRFSERAGPCRQPGESAGVRRDHRASQRRWCRFGAGDRSGLRSHRLRARRRRRFAEAIGDARGERSPAIKSCALLADFVLENRRASRPDQRRSTLLWKRW